MGGVVRAGGAGIMKPIRRTQMKGSPLCPTEHTEQKALIMWAAGQVNRGRKELANLFAIPNGGARHILTARRMSAEGVKSGVPDLFLAWPSSGRCGLFIEMKRRKGSSTSAEQKAWHQQLIGAGYAVVVCKGVEEAMKQINLYLGGIFDGPPCSK